MQPFEVITVVKQPLIRGRSRLIVFVSWEASLQSFIS